MNVDLQEIWVYLAASPHLALTMTLDAYQAGHWLYLKSGPERCRYRLVAVSRRENRAFAGA